MTKRRKRKIIATAIIAAALVSFLVAGCYNSPRLTRLDVPLRNLPPGLDGLKIVQISDLHYRPPFDLYDEVLELVSGENPDIIVITGDLVDDRQYVDKCVEYLRKLKAKHGIWAIRGNWEYWSEIDIPAFERDAAEAGVTFLVNESARVDLPGGTLWLVGVDDPFTRHNDLGKAMSEVPPDAAMVLLAHSPDIFDEASGANVSLVLVGHTHCGQIRLPLVGPVWTPSPTMREYDAGMFRKGDTRMYVNAGIGVSGVKFRFFCRPEVTVITLRP